jgi:tetratricopeptide (TPR) repeat protein
MAEDLYPDLNGSRRSAAVDWLEAEHDNLTFAIRWFVTDGDRAAASRLAGLVWPLWYDRGFRSQGRQTLSMVIAPDGPDEPADIRALRGAAVLSMQAGQFEEAEDLLFRAAKVARSHGETVELAHTLRGLSGLAELRDDSAGMTRYASEVLDIAVRTNDVGMIARAASDLAVGLLAQNQSQKAIPYIEQSIDASRRAGLRDLLILGLGNLAWVRQKQGKQSEAETLARESYRMGMTEGGAWARGVSALSVGGIIAFTSSDEALEYLHQALTSFRDLEDAEDQLFSCELVALCLATSGKEGDSATLWGATHAVRTSMRLPGLSDNRTYWQAELHCARARIPAREWDQQWIRGQDMPLETLVSLALDLSSGC